MNLQGRVSLQGRMGLQGVDRARARRAAQQLRRGFSRRVRPVPVRGRAPAARLLDAGDRLVPSPVFLYSSVRSGSTLLRMILDTHSEVCAPHEMHLRSLHVGFDTWFAQTACKEFNLTDGDLGDLLWDRLLHLHLTRSGKRVIVDKTPGNVLEWKRIARSWPQARYIFLKRHPLRMAESLAASKPKTELSEHVRLINQFVGAWVQARAKLPGPTVSYEELTTDPERTVRGLCGSLGIAWEPAMLDYAAQDHGGRFRRGLGDWRPKIKSGVIHEPEPLPEPGDIPEALLAACEQLGYL